MKKKLQLRVVGFLGLCVCVFSSPRDRFGCRWIQTQLGIMNSH